MHVVIVGGGSAGWITASLLNSELNRVSKAVKITVIESDTIGRIGVGEATVPTMVQTIQKIGISEKEFMKATDATFKQAIKFENWAYNGHKYYHPFDRRPINGEDREGLKWLRTNGESRFDQTVSAQPDLAEAGFSPKMLETPEFEGVFGYAYHMDAEKFADFLSDYSQERGVVRLIDEVVDVKLDHNGFISSLETKKGETISGTLFIDCTGFRRLLIGQFMGSKIKSLGDWLMCDSAVAARVANEPDQNAELNSFTTSTALSNGWCWDIALQGRSGKGYVYSSETQSKDDAEIEFRNFQNLSQDDDVRHLKFNSCYLPESWVKNCVAIGLSGGFLEPLESTGLFLVEVSVQYLIELFPLFGKMDASANIFNKRVSDRYEECTDLVNLHYCLTQRTDTEFWREVARPERITPRLTDLLERWEQKLPSSLDFCDTNQLFSFYNFEYILYGMGWKPKVLKSLSGANSKPYYPQDINLAVASNKQKLFKQHDSLLEWLSK